MRLEDDGEIMSRSRGRGRSNKFRSDFDAYIRERITSRLAIAGTKIAKQALKGICTIRNLSPVMIYFYNKRFKANRFPIKVM